MSLELFDPTLGELNFVDIDITGLLTLQVDFVPLIVPPGTPVLQMVTSTLTGQLDGVIGGDFDFLATPEVQVQHAATVGTFMTLGQPGGDSADYGPDREHQNGRW